jgi:hypothetical protein
VAGSVKIVRRVPVNEMHPVTSFNDAETASEVRPVDYSIQ